MSGSVSAGVETPPPYVVGFRFGTLDPTCVKLRVTERGRAPLELEFPLDLSKALLGQLAAAIVAAETAAGVSIEAVYAAAKAAHERGGAS